MTVKKVDDPGSGIPKYKFDFVSNNVVALRVGQQSKLTDIAGVLRGLSGVITITTRDGFQTIKRDLELENVSGSVLAATLWSENTNLVDDSVLTLDLIFFHHAMLLPSVTTYIRYSIGDYLSEKSDVYSFGVGLLEILTGRKPIDLAESLCERSCCCIESKYVAGMGGMLFRD